MREYGERTSERPYVPMTTEEACEALRKLEPKRKKALRILDEIQRVGGVMHDRFTI